MARDVACRSVHCRRRRADGDDEEGASRRDEADRRERTQVRVCDGAPLVAGAAITYKLWTVRDFAAMAPTWLLLYGAGVLTGGMFSAPVIRAIGACFMTTGIAATLTPPEWGNIWLATGFGGLHIGFGAYIARHYGG